MNNYLKYLAIMFLCIVTLPAMAQKFSTSVNLQVAVPQREYKEVDPDASFGIRANFLYRPRPEIPLKFGLEIGMQQKGGAHQYFSGYINGFYDDFQVSASNNIFSLLFVTRFQPEKIGKLKPFLDLAAGWNVFYSTVNVERLTYFSNYNTSFSNSTKARWALTYGMTGGVDIPLNKRDDLGLELKVAYMLGNNTKYLTNPYINGNAEVSFQEKVSNTDMLIPQAGIRITIK